MRIFQCAVKKLETYKDRPQIITFWLPRIRSIASWFVQTQHDRQQDRIRVLGPRGFGCSKNDDLVTLQGRVDRIDVVPDGTVDIIDYKTGKLPKG